MQIRDMTVDDLDKVMELDKRQVKPWNRYGFGQALRLGHHCVVAEDDKGIFCGYAVSDRGHGRTICVTNSRAAIALYQDWFKYTKEQQIPVLYAETHKDSVESIAMFIRFGFTKQGTRPSYYGPGEDATVWARPNLTDSTIGYQGRSPLQVSEPV